MIIRLAREGFHLDKLMQLAEQWLNPLWDKATKREWLTTILTSKGEHLIIVAEETLGGKLLGFVDFFSWDDWLTKKRRIFIQHVYVDKDHRNKGIATEMLNKIFIVNHPDYAFVDTKPEKFPNAEGLYKKVGFKENPKRKWLERYVN